MMSLTVPPRPFRRSAGALDAFIAQQTTPHMLDEAAPGVRVDVQGWIVDAGNDPCPAAWVAIGDFTVPIPLNKNRADVATRLVCSDRDGKHFGFSGTIVVPIALPPGVYDARVIGRTRHGGGVYAADSRRVRIASPQRRPDALQPPDHPIDFDVRVSDTQTASRTFGRGAWTIRQESSLRLTGFVEDANAIQVTATPAAGDPIAWEVICDAGGRFDAALWIGGMERGLLDMQLGRCETGGTIVACARFGVEIAGPHYIPPLHLGVLLTPPRAEILAFADAGPHPTNEPARSFVAGRPIGVSGWCLDAATPAPPLAVYVEIDGKRPVPLSHHLIDPRPNAQEPLQRCGFSGIIDTTRLAPGNHRFRILAAAVSGAGWYVVDERHIELSDHRIAAHVAYRS